MPFIIQNDFLFDFAVGKSAGSLSPRVKWTHLKEFAIELPLMPEQSKLAETLWSINETKNAYEDLINKTDELVKSKFALQEAIKDLDALTKKIIAENLIPAGKE